MNAISRRLILKAAGAAAMTGIGNAGAGAGGPVVDLDEAADRLTRLNAAHRAGTESAAGYAALARQLTAAADHNPWSGRYHGPDLHALLMLTAAACERAAMTTWGQADDALANGWARHGAGYAQRAVELGVPAAADRYALLIAASALARTFDPHPTLSNTLHDLGRVAAWPLDPEVGARVAVEQSYAHAKVCARSPLGSRAQLDAGYQALAAHERAVRMAGRSGAPGLLSWVESGAWATVIGTSGGRVGGGVPLLETLAKGLGAVSSPRGRASTLISMAWQALQDGDLRLAADYALEATETTDPQGRLIADARGARRLGAIADGLPAGWEAGRVLRRRLNGTAG